MKLLLHPSDLFLRVLGNHPWLFDLVGSLRVCVVHGYLSPFPDCYTPGSWVPSLTDFSSCSMFGIPYSHFCFALHFASTLHSVCHAKVLPLRRHLVLSLGPSRSSHLAVLAYICLQHSPVYAVLSHDPQLLPLCDVLNVSHCMPPTSRTFVSLCASSGSFGLHDDTCAAEARTIIVLQSNLPCTKALITCNQPRIRRVSGS